MNVVVYTDPMITIDRPNSPRLMSECFACPGSIRRAGVYGYNEYAGDVAVKLPFSGDIIAYQPENYLNIVFDYPWLSGNRSIYVFYPIRSTVYFEVRNGSVESCAHVQADHITVLGIEAYGPISEVARRIWNSKSIFMDPVFEIRGRTVFPLTEDEEVAWLRDIILDRRFDRRFVSGGGTS